MFLPLGRAIRPPSEFPWTTRAVSCSLRDTAGGLKNSYFVEGSDAYVLAYSVTNQSSFSNLPYWFDHIQECSSQSEALAVSPKIIIGCKCDLEEERQVSYEMAKDFADDRGVLLLEVSSKDGTNVEQVFITLVILIRELIYNVLHSE